MGTNAADPYQLEKKMPILKTYPKSGRFIVDTLYDKIRAFHCRHPVGWGESQK
jgi:hypothetical protein